MTVETWTTIFVIISFIVYLYIGWRSRVRDSKGFFVADRGVPAIANGAATAADIQSAAVAAPLAIAGTPRSATKNPLLSRTLDLHPI